MMSDIRLKFLILRAMLREAFDAWRSGYWERSLDEQYCCDGRECGCQGSSLRDVWTFEISRAAHQGAGEP